MFHMPFFFFVSGYLFSEKQLHSFGPFLKKKIKSLWWPFFKWNIIFILLHNLLFRLGIEVQEYTWIEALKRILLSGLMAESETLLGTFWFLQQLIRVVLMGWGILKLHQLCCQRKSHKNSTWFMAEILLTIVLITTLNYSIDLRIKGIIYKLTFLCLTFFLSGYTYKLYSAETKSQKMNTLLALLGVVSTIIGSIYMPVKMQTVNTCQIIPYWIIGFLGCIMILYISVLLQETRLASILDYIGKHTLHIMIWHFLSFKLLTLLFVKIGVMPQEYLLSFPVPPGTQHGLWIIYSAIGVVVPIATKILIERLSKKLLRKEIFNI